MHFALTDEQRMLADMVDRLIEKSYSFEQRKQSVAAPHGYSPEVWRTLAQTGLLGLHVPESFGGMDASPAETCVVMEAFGRGLLVEPFVQNAVVAARLLGQAGSEWQRNRLLPRIAAGEQMLAIACHEPVGRFDLWNVTTTATPVADGWRIDGAKCTVPFGDSADHLLVTARTSGSALGPDGISVFLVDRGASGVATQGFKTFDGLRAAEVRFESVQVGHASIVGAKDRGLALLEAALDEGIAATCAESVGAMQRLLDLSIDYLRTRKQFGRPIGTFQALQHRLAEMFMSVEQARSAALLAAAHARNPDASERRRAVSAAKALVGRYGRQVGEAAIQLHGGMGMTDEMPCGHCFKRLVGLDKTWGDSAHHAEVFALSVG